MGTGVLFIVGYVGLPIALWLAILNYDKFLLFITAKEKVAAYKRLFRMNQSKPKLFRQSDIVHFVAFFILWPVFSFLSDAMASKDLSIRGLERSLLLLPLLGHIAIYCLILLVRFIKKEAHYLRAK